MGVGAKEALLLELEPEPERCTGARAGWGARADSAAVSMQHRRSSARAAGCDRGRMHARAAAHLSESDSAPPLLSVNPGKDAHCSWARAETASKLMSLINITSL